MNSDEHKSSFVCLFNCLGSVLHSTGVVVGPLAASYFASCRGAFLLTFAAHLQKTHAHTQHSGFSMCLADRVSLNQQSLPAFSHVSPPPARPSQRSQTSHQTLEYFHSKGRKQTAAKQIKAESGVKKSNMEGSRIIPKAKNQNSRRVQ